LHEGKQSKSRWINTEENNGKSKVAVAFSKQGPGVKVELEANATEYTKSLQNKLNLV